MITNAILTNLVTKFQTDPSTNNGIALSTGLQELIDNLSKVRIQTLCESDKQACLHFCLQKVHKFNNKGKAYNYFGTIIACYLIQTKRRTVMIITNAQKQQLIDLCIDIEAHMEIDSEITIDGNGVNACEAVVVSRHIAKILNLAIDETSIEARVQKLESEYV